MWRVIAYVVCLIASGLADAQTLRIFHIDVEQGDSTLLITPNGRTLLIDSGDNGKGRRIKSVMDDAGVSQIDVFVATHYHKDHYGGIDELVDSGVPVIKAFDRGDKAFLPSSKLGEATYVAYEQTIGAHAAPLMHGHTIDIDPSVVITCIAAGGMVVGEAHPHDPTTAGTDENDMSVALLITMGEFRYFIGGDIEGHTESKIAQFSEIAPVSIYQADHHGSDTSSSRAFMEALSPQTVIISNGNHGGFKHPRTTTLQLYGSLPTPPSVFQTNKYLKGGTGSNVPDEFIADLASTGDDGTILVTTDSVTGAYTVGYRGMERIFIFSEPAQPPIRVVIESLLPNPVGDDRMSENVTIRNDSSVDVIMDGWQVQDLSGSAWGLVGTIRAGEQITYTRNGLPMSLNNDGDIITLIKPGNVLVDLFDYSGSAEGEVILTGH